MAKWEVKLIIDDEDDCWEIESEVMSDIKIYLEEFMDALSVKTINAVKINETEETKDATA